MSKVQVILGQDLIDFTDDLDGYITELEKRLSGFYHEVVIEVDNEILEDEIFVNEEEDKDGFVLDVMRRMEKEIG